jgi:hypothetical protein
VSDEYLATQAPINDLTSIANATLVIDLNQFGPKVRYTLSGNVTVTGIANPRSGVFYTIWFKQDATGSRTVAWAAGLGIKWAGGSAPTITAGAGKQDQITILWDQLNAGFLASVIQNF